jgi:hypothetical protein
VYRKSVGLGLSINENKSAIPNMGIRVVEGLGAVNTQLATFAVVSTFC